jgi:hypothetical protein
MLQSGDFVYTLTVTAISSSYLCPDLGPERVQALVVFVRDWVIEADVIDKPPEGKTFASGVDPQSIRLYLNDKLITSGINITSIDFGKHIKYTTNVFDLKIPGMNEIILKVKDQASANDTANSVEHNWSFIIE